MRLAAALALLLAAMARGHPAAQGADRRVVVDPNEPPWNAVAKVQTNIGEDRTQLLTADPACQVLRVASRSAGTILSSTIARARAAPAALRS